MDGRIQDGQEDEWMDREMKNYNLMQKNLRICSPRYLSPLMLTYTRTRKEHTHICKDKYSCTRCLCRIPFISILIHLSFYSFQHCPCRCQFANVFQLQLAYCNNASCLLLPLSLSPPPPTTSNSFFSFFISLSLIHSCLFLNMSSERHCFSAPYFRAPDVIQPSFFRRRLRVASLQNLLQKHLLGFSRGRKLPRDFLVASIFCQVETTRKNTLKGPVTSS